MARQVDIVLTLNAAGVVTGGKAGVAGVKGIEQQAKKTEKALERVGRQGKKAGDQIGRTMRSGRAGALSLNRIVQDLPFGFIAIQNNVTELAASFTVMKQNGLSSAEAMKSILSQFKGPGGLLFIISAAVALITAFGGKIVEAFNKGKTSAKELTAALETLLTIQRKLNKFEISAEDIEAKLLRTRELIANATEKTHEFTVLLAGATVSMTDAEREALKINLARLNGLKALEKQLEKQLETSKALAIEQEVLAAIGAPLDPKEAEREAAAKRRREKAAERARKAAERARKAAAKLAREAATTLQTLEAELLTEGLQKRLLLIDINFETESGKLREKFGKQADDMIAALEKGRDRLKDSALIEELRTLLDVFPDKPGIPIDFIIDDSGELDRLLKDELPLLDGSLKSIQANLVDLREKFLLAISDEVRMQINEQIKAFEKMEEAILASVDAVSKLNVAEETLGNFAGAFGDIARIQQEAIERDLAQQNRNLADSLDDRILLIESSLAERKALFIEAGLSEEEASRRAQEGVINARKAAGQQIANLQEENERKAADAVNRQFRVAKAFAVAEAIVATFNAANKALASAPPPLSFALMASTIAVGLANVAAIVSAKPGGSVPSSGGGSGAGTSSTPVGLGGIRVQNRGFTIGATGAAPGARAPMDLRIEVIEKDLFTINVLLKNADGVRAQVGSI